jgi:hypothetical protein
MAIRDLPPDTTTHEAGEQEIPPAAPLELVSANPAEWTPPRAAEEPRSSAADLQGRFATAEAGVAASPVRLVLRGAPWAPPDTLSLRLARLLGLDAWGDFLLGRRVAQEMGAAAFVLLVVLTFELISWSLLFNVLVNSAHWRLSWLTPLACVLASVFAGGVFLFERSFITADLGERPWKKGLAYGLRLCIIAGSCIATSQPVELLVFGGAIETRLRDENALTEAVRLETDRQQYTADQKEPAAAVDPDLRQRQRDYLAQRDSLVTTVKEIEEDIKRADQSILDGDGRARNWRGRVDRAGADLKIEREKPESDPVRVETLKKRLRGAEISLASSLDQVKRARAERDSLQGQWERKKADLQAVQELLNPVDAKVADTKAANEQVRAERERQAKQGKRDLQAWMRVVQTVTPGETAVLNVGGTYYKLPPKAADFTDRLRVLEDLKDQVPPQWPAADPPTITLAASAFHLEDPYGPGDRKLAERRRGDARLFSRTYWIAFVIAAVIPLLTLAFKLMVSQELASYYSAAGQARAGNPEAILALRARGLDVESLADPAPPRPRLWQRIWRRFRG